MNAKAAPFSVMSRGVPDPPRISIRFPLPDDPPADGVARWRHMQDRKETSSRMADPPSQTTVHSAGRRSQPVPTTAVAFPHILADFSLREIWRHLKWINDNTPARNPGSSDQNKAAEYFVDQLDRCDVLTQLEWFTTYSSVPLKSALVVTSPVSMELPCHAFSYTEATPKEGLELPLLRAGAGSEADYAGLNVSGRAVLVEMNSQSPRSEQAFIAARHGAKAIVFMHWGSSEFHAVPFGTIKYVTGNPTQSMLGAIPRIAAIGISRAAGDRLVQLSHDGEVTVRIVAQTTDNWGPLPQSWGRLRSPNNPNDDYVVIGCHFDAWRPGMSDNAAGNALVLELARNFAARREALRRDVVFCFWNGHEIGHCEGATWFADRYWDDLDQHAVAYLNVDSVGLAQSTVYHAESTPELRTFHLDVERRVLGGEPTHGHLRCGTANPFCGLGLPALAGHFRPTPEQVEAWEGAERGWWWHTAADTIDKVDHNRLRETAVIYAHYIWEMCTLPVLPTDFGPMASHISRRVMEMQTRAAGRFELDLPIEPFTRSVAALREFSKQVTAENDAQRVNGTLMRLSRLILPAFETPNGRQGPDRLDVDQTNSPIPAVHALRELPKIPPDSEKAHLLYTELLRNRNRLSDALRWATRAIDDLLESNI